MNIYSIFSSYAAPLFRENLLPALTAQQKKILIIASLAFGFITALYVASRCRFQAQLLNGQGKITPPNGDVLEGEFKNGKLNGPGKITFSDGVVHEGEFKDDKLNGQGKMTFSGGVVHEGEFENSKLNGPGKISNILSGKVFAKGIFQDGILIQSTV